MDNSNLMNNNGEYYPQGQMIPPPDPTTDPAFIKKKTGQAVNRTSGALVIHFLILQLVASVIQGVQMGMYMSQGHSMQEFLDFYTTDGFYMLVCNALAYMVAHPLAYIIGLAFTGRIKGSAKMFRKPDISPKLMLAAFGSALGLQGVSMLFQIIFTMVTGSSGVENMNMDMLSYGGNTTKNIVLFLYMVILGPIGEELILRGMALKNLSCTNRVFAMVCTSVMFGLFHGNIMQFIVGFLLGMLFAYLTLKSGSIIPAIIFHITNNAIAFIMGVVQYHATEEFMNVFSYIYLAVLLIAGIFSGLYLLKHLRSKPYPDSEYTPVYDVPAEAQKSYSWNLAFKSPCFWVFSIIYILYIIANI
ncbi:MAG: CPBP family intramembrane metalloprotease [Oscillospiraceae bacterium]|nr:CPBP family intramembrane metalloprotease [Oscillospiraceae bacterium]